MAKAKKTTKKTKAKVAKKTTKKTAKKTTKKVAKKTTKKASKKTTKKAVSKASKKTTKKVAKKPAASKKTSKKVAKKVSKTSVKKTAAKKVVKKAVVKKTEAKSSSSKAPSTNKSKAPKAKSAAAKSASPKTSNKYQEEVTLDKDIEKKIKTVTSQKLKEQVAEEVIQLSEDYKLNDIFESIRDVSYFQNYSDECVERNCDSPSSTKGFCRLHYISNWKNVKKREAILIDGKLQDFIEDLAKKYPLKSIELVLNDLSDEKSFFAALNEMDIESMDDDQDSISEDGIEDDDQDMAFETKSTKSGYYDE